MAKRSKGKRSVGIAVVGAGKIGRHRARLASEHAGVGFLAIADIDGAKAETLAEETGADTWSTDVDAIVGSSDIDAVIVSTEEKAHRQPVVAAVRAGKPTLVEKPIALTLEDADAMVAEATNAGVPLWVGYSMRYAQRYAVGREQLDHKHIGGIIGGVARCYDTRAVARAILGRSPTATPVMDILTYMIDIIGWYHQEDPVEVIARANGSTLRQEGLEAEDFTTAMVTYADGAVFQYATSYSLPTGFPINGMAARFEILGTDGVLLITEDHGDQVLYSGIGHTNEYVDQTNHLAYLGSRTSGEWVRGRMFGRVADETRAWLDHLTTGAPLYITTASEARRTLQVTLAIDEAAATGRTITLD